MAQVNLPNVGGIAGKLVDELSWWWKVDLRAMEDFTNLILQSLGRIYREGIVEEVELEDNHTGRDNNDAALFVCGKDRFVFRGARRMLALMRLYKLKLLISLDAEEVVKYLFWIATAFRVEWPSCDFYLQSDLRMVGLLIFV